jgi:hypothetical protein
MCLHPDCATSCDRCQPACIVHWRNAPDVLRDAITEAWRDRHVQRWLWACAALHLYWRARSSTC